MGTDKPSKDCVDPDAKMQMGWDRLDFFFSWNGAARSGGRHAVAQG